ncbi:MAG: ribosome silencing factor [Pseudomonadota bacterium]
MPENIAQQEKTRLMAAILLEHKAEDVVALHIGPLVSFAEYFIVASGRSSRHVRALAEHLREEMARQGLRPLGVEGESDGTWILLDYNEVIVHVFHEPTRRFYDLESLWADARWLDLSSLSPPPGLPPQ